MKGSKFICITIVVIMVMVLGVFGIASYNSHKDTSSSAKDFRVCNIL